MPKKRIELSAKYVPAMLDLLTPNQTCFANSGHKQKPQESTKVHPSQLGQMVPVGKERMIRMAQDQGSVDRFNKALYGECVQDWRRC